MWKCDRCNKDFDDSVHHETVEDCMDEMGSTWEILETFCYRCKWYNYNHDGMDAYMSAMCPICTRSSIPCKGHQEAAATDAALEMLREERRKKKISDKEPVSKEENEMAEGFKRQKLSEFANERSKKGGAYQEAKRKSREMEERYLEFQDAECEKHQQAARKRQRNDMIQGEKDIAAGTFKGRTRECSDCKVTFPWQPRKTLCRTCYAKSMSKKPAAATLTSKSSGGDRKCKDCNTKIDASEPQWKVRCLSCYLASKNKK